MITVLSMDANAFFNTAFEHIAGHSFGCAITMTQSPKLTRENISQADVIILPLVRGETAVCHQALKYRKPGSLLVGVCRQPISAERHAMVNCLKDTIFIQRSETIDQIGKRLRHAWNSLRGSCQSCQNCQPSELTLSQQRVAESFIHGIPTQQIARQYNMNSKTVASHKYGAMDKFGLRNQFELLQFLRCLYSANGTVM